LIYWPASISLPSTGGNIAAALSGLVRRGDHGQKVGIGETAGLKTIRVFHEIKAGEHLNINCHEGRIRVITQGLISLFLAPVPSFMGAFGSTCEGGLRSQLLEPRFAHW
jgi:hypothetical protein